jgi:hypothetical protein
VARRRLEKPVLADGQSDGQSAVEPGSDLLISDGVSGVV